MKKGFVKSSPIFFRLVFRAFWAAVALLLAGAWILPAPLHEAADPAITPNPARSAWFLLWIQEMVSWSKMMIYPVFVFALLFVLLPWLPMKVHMHRARWFPREQLVVSGATIAAAALIAALTLIAMFLRGDNWSLVF